MSRPLDTLSVKVADGTWLVRVFDEPIDTKAAQRELERLAGVATRLLESGVNGAPQRVAASAAKRPAHGSVTGEPDGRPARRSPSRSEEPGGSHSPAQGGKPAHDPGPAPAGSSSRRVVGASEWDSKPADPGLVHLVLDAVKAASPEWVTNADIRDTLKAIGIDDANPMRVSRAVRELVRAGTVESKAIHPMQPRAGNLYRLFRVAGAAP